MFERPTGARHTFTVRHFRGHVLDVEDVHFHFDSAVLLPDFGDCGADVDPSDRNRITGLAVVRATYLHAQAHPGQKVLVTGHTDREGRDAYNLELSRLRAENVLHILQGNRQSWIDVCGRKHRVEDYQQILRWVDVIWGWGCSPGNVDNVPGPRTTEAIKVFQARYNRGARRMPRGFRADIVVDGIVGEETWGAFFDVYMRVLELILGVDSAGLRARQQALHFVEDGRKTVGCGENFPLTANPVSPARTQREREEMRRLARVDRRVEILFFDPGEEPVLDCHPGTGRCVPAACEIYDHLSFRLQPLPCEPIRLEWRNLLRSTYALDCLTIVAKVNPFRAFRAWIWHIVGDDIPVEAIERLYNGLADRRFQSPLAFDQSSEVLRNPEIHIVRSFPEGSHSTRSVFHRERVLGAYSEGTIYVGEELVNRAYTDQEQALTLLAVLTEEFGHHVDRVLRFEFTDRSLHPEVRPDAPLDEGAVFASMLCPADNTGVVGFEFAYDVDDEPLRIESIPSRSAWGAFFPEDRIFADRQMRTANGERVEHFAASDIEQRGGHVHMYGHEGIERAAFRQLGWAEERRKYVYFGNWQRDFSQFGDPRIILAIDAVRQALPRFTQRFHSMTQFDFVVDGVSDIARVLRDAVCGPQQQIQNQIIQWHHNQQRSEWGWVIPALLDVLAEDKFGQGFPVIDNESSSYSVGVYQPKEHIDNPSTIDTGYGHLDGRFRPPFSQATEGGVINDAASPRYLLRRYVEQSITYMLEEYELAARTGLTASFGVTEQRLRYMHLGNGLHTLEDYFAHSNFCELWLRRRGHDVDVFVDLITVPPLRDPVHPVVTGTFGGVDTAMSIVGVVFHHLASAEQEGPFEPGPSKLNRLVLILLRRHCAPVANYYAAFLDVQAFLRLPGQIREWIADGYRKMLQFLRKELAWAATEMILEMIIPGFCRIAGASDAERQRALQAVDTRNPDTIIDVLLEIARLPAADRDFVRAAATLVDLDHRGDVVVNMRDPETLAEVLEELAGLYQRIETQGTNEPTHTQLGKDHATHPLHLLAAEIATWAVKKVGGAMSLSWDQNRETLAMTQLRTIVDRVVRHPSRYQDPEAVEVDAIVARWEAANQAAIARLVRLHHETPLDVRIMAQRQRFLRNCLRNLRGLLQRVRTLAR